MKNENLPVQDFSAHTPMMQQYGQNRAAGRMNARFLPFSV